MTIPIFQAIKVFFIASMVYCLSSCVNLNYKNNARCIQLCHAQQKLCASRCQNNCTDCNYQNCRDINRGFRQYWNEKKLTGSDVTRELNSYEDPLQCSKISCDCMADYDACQQSCKGHIDKHLMVPSVCLKS